MYPKSKIYFRTRAFESNLMNNIKMSPKFITLVISPFLNTSNPYLVFALMFEVCDASNLIK